MRSKCVKNGVLLAVMLGLTGAVRVEAGTYVTGPLPAEFGGGFVPSDPNVLKNVQKATKETAKLAAAVEKCYAKGAQNFAKGKATGVATCLDDPKKGVRSKFIAKIGSIGGKAPGLPPCHDFVAAGDTVAALVRGFNAATYCAGPAATASPSPVPSPTATAAPTASPTPAPTASPTPTPFATCATATVVIATTYETQLPPDVIAAVATFLDYPQARVAIPGTANQASVLARVTKLASSAGIFSAADSDTDADTVDDRIAVGLFGTVAIPPGNFAQVVFDCVAGQPQPQLADFTCTPDVSSLFGNPVAATCEVVSLTYAP
jgi:hypothetical protein